MTETSHRELQQVRSERDRALDTQARFAFLARSSRILSESLDYEETLTKVAAMALPYLGGWCIVDVVEDGEIRRLAVIHPDAGKQALARELHERYPPETDDVLGVKHVIDSGRSEVVAQVSKSHLQYAARDAEHLNLIRALGIGSYVIVPLRARGSTLGAMTFVTSEDERRIGDSDLLLAEDLGCRCAMTIDNARLFQTANAAQANAEKAVRHRDEVIGIVAHDLRNPIHAIQLQAELALGRDMDVSEERRDDAVRGIQRTAERMERLVQGILDTRRIESGHVLAVRPEPIDLAGLLEDACAYFMPQAEAKGVRLEYPLPEIASAIYADPERLLQVFWNLLGNAIKFTAEGGLIEVGCEAEAEGEGERLRFWVRDTGPGISAEELPRLFDPFWQAKRTARLGTGLGLPISKALIEAHGGTIDVESVEGEGTTFYFTVPTAQQHNDEGEDSSRLEGDFQAVEPPK